MSNFILGPKPYIVLAFYRKIRKVTLDSKQFSVLVPVSTGSAVAIDYDYSTSTMYWTDRHTLSIQSASLKNPLIQKKIVNESIFNPEALSVDWVNKKLYWADAGVKGHKMTISVVDFDGRNRLTLIKLTRQEKPADLQVYPSTG